MSTVMPEYYLGPIVGRGEKPGSDHTFQMVERLAGPYRSRTRRALLEPEQQIIMVLLASRSAVVSTRSRWSGVPSRTRISQVPHTPSVQEYGASTPASSSASRMVLPS